MTMTLHSPQVHGFFSVPTDPLTARPLFVRYFKTKAIQPNETIVVAPDIGRAKSAARFAAQLHLPVAAAEKTRLSDREVRLHGTLSKQVEGYRRALVYDDEIATGATVEAVCRLLIQQGISEIAIICTHGLFCGDTLKRLAEIPQVNEIITTNTVPITADKKSSKLHIISVAPVFAEAILKNYNRQSIGDLFAFYEDAKRE
jgi:ribose-phosphate pyrophosphokinase